MDEKLHHNLKIGNFGPGGSDHRERVQFSPKNMDPVKVFHPKDWCHTYLLPNNMGSLFSWKHKSVLLPNLFHKVDNS